MSNIKFICEVTESGDSKLTVQGGEQLPIEQQVMAATSAAAHFNTHFCRVFNLEVSDYLKHLGDVMEETKHLLDAGDTVE